MKFNNPKRYFMKLKITVILCALVMVASAQKKVSATKLEISYDKTLHLIFDNKVKYIDAEKKDIVAEIIPTLNNIVRVKVNNENFKGSRGLSVITADGIFHSFELTFKEDVDYSTYLNTNDSCIKTIINVTTDKSTHLIFPKKIIYFNIGNEETLSSSIINSSNILKINALTKEKVLPTSLFIVTEDKKYYDFIMNSEPSAETYTYNFSNSENVALFDNTANDKTLASVAEKCLKMNRTISSVGEKKNKLTCFLNNVHINNDVLYFTFEIINTSTLNMNIDFLKCFIKDKKTIKNSPEQEIESIPILTYKYLTTIDSNRSNTFVLAFPKFTIPDKKKFEVEIYDKDGGRHLAFTIKDDLIIDAKPI